MKKEIIEILEKYEFDPAQNYDSNERHIDSDDFKRIADDILLLINKNDVIADVSGSFTKQDMFKFASKCLLLQGKNDGKDLTEILADYISNDR